MTLDQLIIRDARYVRPASLGAFPLALAEAVTAKLVARATGARAFWFQAKSLGNTGHERLIEAERIHYERAEALATEAAEVAHGLSVARIAMIFSPRNAA
jgi:hypothetical protein